MRRKPALVAVAAGASLLNRSEHRAVVEAARLLRHQDCGPIWSRSLKQHDSGLTRRFRVELTRDLLLRISSSEAGRLVEVPIGVALQMLARDECSAALAL